jgi:hypothetical protein
MINRDKSGTSHTFTRFLGRRKQVNVWDVPDFPNTWKQYPGGGPFQMKRGMLLAALFGLIASGWAADPFVGTWKLNLSKSKYNPPSSAPKSGTIRTAASATGYKSVGDGVDSEGKETHWESAPILDGKAHAVVGNPDHEYVATKVDTHTITAMVRKGGIEVGSERSVLSSDGKTLTVTSKRKDAQGQEISSIMVFDKQ